MKGIKKDSGVIELLYPRGSSCVCNFEPPRLGKGPSQNLPDVLDDHPNDVLHSLQDVALTLTFALHSGQVATSFARIPDLAVEPPSDPLLSVM